jgi:hypothetical protein
VNGSRSSHGAVEVAGEGKAVNETLPSAVVQNYILSYVQELDIYVYTH